MSRYLGELDQKSRDALASARRAHAFSLARNGRVWSGPLDRLAQSDEFRELWALVYGDEYLPKGDVQ